MKKSLSLLAATWMFTAVAEQSYVAPLAERSLLLDIAAHNYVIVVGERGHILRSDDGKAFEQIQVPTTATLTGVTIKGDDVWVVGHDAVILYSADQGRTWQLQHQQAEWQRPLLDVVFFDNQHGVAVGAYGLFLRTENGGSTWQQEQHITLVSDDDRAYLEDIKEEDESFYQEELGSILPHINSAFFDNNIMLLAGESGLLARSSNQGRSWERFEVDYNGSFFDVIALNNDSLVAVGLRGNSFVYTNNDGWQPFSSCTTSTLNAVIKVNPNQLMLLGNNGMVVNLPLNTELAERTDDACHDDTHQTQQLPNKVALLNGVVLNEQVLAVSAGGIKKINTN